MKQILLRLRNLIETRAGSFSLLEIGIVLIGVGIGIIVYNQMLRTSSILENGRLFDREYRDFSISISLADLHLNELIGGNTEIDLQRDVLSLLDGATGQCDYLEKGGPDGRFMPTMSGVNVTPQPPNALCTQLEMLRELAQLRGQDYLNGQPDAQLSAYQSAYQQLLQVISGLKDAADPHTKEASTQTRQRDLVLCFGLVSIFIAIAWIIWRSRRMMTAQTHRLETEVEQHARLNAQLDNERNLVNTLIDNLPDAVFAKDRQGRFLIANPATARMLGVPQKEILIGKTWSEFAPTDHADQTLRDDAHVLSTGKTLSDCEDVFIDRMTGRTHWCQTTKVPLRDREGQIIGLVGISRDITQHIESEAALKSANDQLTAGIITLERSTHEAELLGEMVDLLQACPNTEEACIVIADQLSKIFPEDSGQLYLFHPSRNMLDQVAAWGAGSSNPVVVKPDECWGLRRGRMHIAEYNSLSASQENGHVLLCPHIKTDRPADYLCVPLVAQGEALGLMHLCHFLETAPDTVVSGPEAWYNHAKRQRIHTIIDSISLALANLKLRSSLRQQSIRDPLTGMFNRRYMEETLEREILRATRSHETVGVIMMDIDHFKLFNDTFGHQAGDALLTALGHFFLANVRGEDVACRYGGEEFILLMPGISLEEVCRRTEILREQARFVNVSFQGQSLGTVTLSFGISMFPEHGTTSELLVQTADRALYHAKQTGRDCVVVA